MTVAGGLSLVRVSTQKLRPRKVPWLDRSTIDGTIFRIQSHCLPIGSSFYLPMPFTSGKILESCLMKTNWGEVQAEQVVYGGRIKLKGKSYLLLAYSFRSSNSAK